MKLLKTARLKAFTLIEMNDSKIIILSNLYIRYPQ